MTPDLNQPEENVDPIFSVLSIVGGVIAVLLFFAGVVSVAEAAAGTVARHFPPRTSREQIIRERIRRVGL